MMIRNIQVLAIAILISSIAMGYRSPRVCLSDGNTPLELVDPCVPWVYRDIMVGTHLTIIVDSNKSGKWGYGELSIWGTDRDYGVLAGRDCNEETLECPGSVLPAAGDEANVFEFEESDACGISFWINDGAVAGDWFIVDYNASKIGNCQVDFYDLDVNMTGPLCSMSFTHVPSRDFNKDHIVNFADFAVVGLYWGMTNCMDPNRCGKVDFDGDKIIDINDLRLFSEYWLERTD
ncbi:MAG: hypothetical protein ABSG82_06010 [Sedimentisphaerales bacterium]|jgi:hypothetical protein